MKILLLSLLTVLFIGCGSGGSSFIAPSPINTSQIDLSGLVWSEYAGNQRVLENKGWIKGWVAAPTKAVVTKHASPKPGQLVYVFDKEGTKHERTIVETTNVDIAFADLDRTNGGDISVITVNKPWPIDVKIYEMAVSQPRQFFVTHKDGSLSHRFTGTFYDSRYLIGEQMFYHKKLTPGSSGLPWFNGNGQVVSHTFRGGYGEGPNYTNPEVRKLIKDKL